VSKADVNDSGVNSETITRTSQPRVSAAVVYSFERVVHAGTGQLIMASFAPGAGGVAIGGRSGAAGTLVYSSMSS
jgi:hypothetical protein